MADLISMLAAASGIGAEEADPNFNQTVLLLHGDGTNGAQNNTFLDSSSNNFTITRNPATGPNAPTQGTFSPFSVAAGEWSNYFDGNGDFLSIDSSASPSGTEDFCVELWYTPGIKPSNYPTIFSTNTTYSFSTAFQIYDRHDAYITKFSVYGCGINGMASTTTVTPGVTYHIAVTRNLSGGVYTLRLFVNGVLEASQTGASGSLSSNSCFIGRADTASLALSYLNGYVSNFRIVRGSSVYTSAFTPSTTPLTAITNTSLLTCQSNRFFDANTQAAAKTITRNGDVRVTPFSPFAPTAAYSAGTNGGSGYFDGTGDYVQTPSNSAVSAWSTNFTVDCWVYATAIPATMHLWTNSTSNSDQFTSCYVKTTGAICIGRVGLNESSSASGVIKLNQWHYVALVRNGSNVNIYVDGVSVVTASTTNLETSTTRPLTVGGTFQTVGDVGWNGFISNFRVMKGTAITTFTPPTTPFTSDANTSLLLNFTNAGIFDNTGKNNLETVGDAQIDTTTKKYGTGSMEFDGTGDYLLLPNNVDQQLGTGNFTIEFWVYLATGDTGSARGLVAKGTSTTGFLVSLDSSQKVVFTFTTSTITSSGAITTNAWNYIAVVREGTGSNQTKIYIGGVNDGTGTVSTDFNQTSVMYIGANRTGGDPMKGFIDDLRITKGIARTITVPTAAFPNQ